MTQIASGTIVGNDEYINLETELSLSLTADKQYTIQIQKGASVCEKITKPNNDEGYYWDSLQPFGYTKESDNLWIRVNKGKSVHVNVGD